LLHISVEHGPIFIFFPLTVHWVGVGLGAGVGGLGAGVGGLGAGVGGLGAGVGGLGAGVGGLGADTDLHRFIFESH